mmetsp:Transcript_77287/g.122030  ORF Transcript_77287/g.122030 Transcript_77287/m.122030 type:complete len:80 (+) Transcript_77287:193-432(+)
MRMTALKTEVVTVESIYMNVSISHLQSIYYFLPYSSGCRGSECHDGHMRQLRPQRSKTFIRWTKIMTPFTYAMNLINCQ